MTADDDDDDDDGDEDDDDDNDDDDDDNIACLVEREYEYIKEWHNIWQKIKLL